VTGPRAPKDRRWHQRLARGTCRPAGAEWAWGGPMAQAPQTLVDNAQPRPKTLLAVMKRHPPDQQAGPATPCILLLGIMRLVSDFHGASSSRKNRCGSLVLTGMVFVKLPSAAKELVAMTVQWAIGKATLVEDKT